MTTRILSASEEQSARIARDIHDEVGSMLTVLRWDLEALYHNVNNLPADAQPDQLAEKLGAMITLTDSVLNSVKRIVSQLRPAALDLMSLSDAVQWQATEFQQRTGITVTCDCAQQTDDVSPEKATTVFRILQEALTNVLKHAQASTLDVRLERTKEALILIIKDNGRGITNDETWNDRTFGLLGMRERAQLAGGRVEIRQSEGGGTLVRLQIPI